MAVVKIRCSDCQQDIDAYVGEAIVDNKFVWHLSYACPHCNAQHEEDDRGRPPVEIRDAILKQEGEWSLDVLETGSGKTEALKILRQELNWSLAETAQFSKRMPGTVIIGTKTEVELLKKLLLSHRLQAVVNEVTPVTSEVIVSR